tara:strand:+ start:387 stop:644 length:258 start_codon:yes stop_codon:yes gene_type:complete
MKKPIFRVFASYEIKNKKRLSRVKKGVIDTFVLTSNIEEIKKDEELVTRICYLNKKKPEDVVVVITGVDVENQYGETTDRFEDEI